MNHAEIRTTVKLFGGAHSDDWSDSDIDRIFRNIATEYIKRTRALDGSVTVSVPANNPTIEDISAASGGDDFLAERLTAAEVGYVDKGTWASGRAYVVRDLVQGDGSPDSYLYRCISDHTAASGNEPPNGTYWGRVYSKIGTKIFTNYSYDAIRQFYENDGKSGLPTRLGFETNVKAHLWPSPDVAYKLVIKYWTPLEAWTVGTDNEELSLPEEYIEPILPIVAAVLNSANPHSLHTNKDYMRFIGEVIPSDEASMMRPTLDWKDVDEYKLSYPMT
jgi:hypothetical protein|tara:strand:+ start:169 stop:996 length:828 start_codon:yes stop_codon:yes gene_type:complete